MNAPTQVPSKERVNLYEATRAFRDQHYFREHREPEPADYFRAGASWERAAHEPCPGEHEDPDFKREDGSCTICSPQPPSPDDARDAARYRYLRGNQYDGVGPVCYTPDDEGQIVWGDDLDAAVDARLGLTKPGEQA